MTSAPATGYGYQPDPRRNIALDYEPPTPPRPADLADLLDRGRITRDQFLRLQAGWMAVAVLAGTSDTAVSATARGIYGFLTEETEGAQARRRSETLPLSPE